MGGGLQPASTSCRCSSLTVARHNLARRSQDWRNGVRGSGAERNAGDGQLWIPSRCCNRIVPQQQINAEAVLTAPTRRDVIAQQDRAENAQDDKAQIDRGVRGLPAASADRRYPHRHHRRYVRRPVGRRLPAGHGAPAQAWHRAARSQPVRPAGGTEPTAPATNRF